MTTYDAGVARGVYELDITPLERSAKRAAQLLDDLNRRAATPIAPAPAPAPPAARAARGADPAAEAEKQARAAAATERANLALARAQALLAKESGDTAQAISILERALKGSNQSSLAAITTQRQLNRALAEVQKGASGAAGSLQVLPRTIAGLSNEAQAAAGNLVGLFAIGNIAAFAQQTGAAAVQLESTQAALRAVAGSTEQYDRIVATAKGNQLLFGGSLNDNLATLQQFTFIANRTGASIEEINAAAQLLVAVNPAQGIEGAGFALSELASGDTQTIVERFNLPRQAINDLKNEAGGDTQALLAGVTRLLAEQGVTAETLAAGLTVNALAYRNFSAQAEEAQMRLGDFIATAATMPADFVAGGLEGMNELLSIAEKLQAISGQALNIQTYDDYAGAIARANEQAGFFGPKLTALTQAQFAYAQALIVTGTEQGDAFALARQNNAALVATNEFLATAAVEQSNYNERFGRYVEISQEALASNPQLVTSYADIVAALNSGAMSTDEAAAAIERLLGLSGNPPVFDAITRFASDIAATGGEIESSLVSAFDTSDLAAQRAESAFEDARKAIFETANAGGDMETQARAAADALQAAGDAGRVAASGLATSTNELDRLILKFFELQGATGAVSGLGDAIAESGGVRGAIERAAEFESQLNSDLIRATGSTVERLQLVNAELAKTPPNSDERRRLLVERARLEQQIAQESQREAEKAATAQQRLADQAARESERLANQRQREAEREEKERERELERLSELAKNASEKAAEDTRDYYEKIEAETSRHYDALARAQEDYELGASRDQEDFERQRARLLAEGKRAEAAQLTEDFERKRQRSEEDEQRKRERAAEDSAEKLIAIQQEYIKKLQEAEKKANDEGYAFLFDDATPPVAGAAPINPQLIAPGIPNAPPSLPPPTPLAAAGGAQLRIEFAPINLTVDGAVIASAVYPPLEARLDAALSGEILVINVVAPPVGGQAGGVGGPRA